LEVTRWLGYEEESRLREDEAPSNSTRVLVSGEWIQFGLRENRSVVHPAPPQPPKGLSGAEVESWTRWNEPRRELVPNGVLQLAIVDGGWGTRCVWRDGRRTRLEGRLGDFVAYLPTLAETIKDQRRQMQEMQREYREAERRRLEDQLRRQEDQERVRRFREELDRWRFARDVREYAAEVQSVIDASKGQGAYVEEVLERLKWMEAIASQADPIAPIQRKLLSQSSEKLERGARDPMKTAVSAGEGPPK
jgi:hypothetical protein